METWKCPKCGREFKRAEQPHYCGRPADVEEYIAAQEEIAQPKLRELRAILRAAVPEAEERLSWSMPTLWKGRNLIHFAAAKKHIGLYPGSEAVKKNAVEIALSGVFEIYYLRYRRPERPRPWILINVGCGRGDVFPDPYKTQPDLRLLIRG